MSNDNWGEMVIPGVFMIQRNKIVPTEPSLTKEANPYTNPELIHGEIKELEALVRKLKESNTEIMNYLADQSRDRGTDERRLVDVDGQACDEDEEFRAAMIENEHIIREKEVEIKRLEKLIELQHCGKSLHDNPILNHNGNDQTDQPEEEIESPIHIDL